MKKIYFEWTEAIANYTCPYKVKNPKGTRIITATSTLCKKCKYHKGMDICVDDHCLVYCNYESTLMNRNGANEIYYEGANND